MNRRAFLGIVAGAALDPERALFVPGRKLISIPAGRVVLPDVLLPEGYEEALTYHLALSLMAGWRPLTPQPILRYNKALMLAGLAPR